MLHRTSRVMLALVATAALAATAPTTDAAAGDGRAPSPRWAEISRVDGGFRYLASLHDNALTIRREGDRVVLHDRAARRFREALPWGCRRVQVGVGIAASCRVPATATPTNPLRLVIVPQAGDDRVDGSMLPATVRLVVMAAAGGDVAFGGAADDELNGALDVDRMYGGAGDDLVRVGPGHDVAEGNDGEDTLVGTDGADQLSGNEGQDVLEGGPGNDTLRGGPAGDDLYCGDGFDTTDDDGQLDGVHQCEQVLP